MRSKSYLRIIWAIMSRDILEAVRNKVILSVLIPTILMIVLYRYLPSLEAGDVLPRLAVYDQGESRLVQDLSEHEAFDLYEMPDLQTLEKYIADKDIPILGIVLPSNFDQKIASAQKIEVDGYIVHWISDIQENETRSFFEQKISAWAGKSVAVRLATVYTQSESRGYAFLAALAVVFTVSMIGISVIPHLMFEEKQEKTLHALLVSPASIVQVVIGKALAGAFYTLLAVIFALLINNSLVAHWGMALLAGLCGAMFANSLGLLLGMAFENRQEYTIWGFVIFIPLLLPAFLSIMSELLPAKFLAVINWLPTVALSRAVRASFAYNPSIAAYITDLAVVLVYALPFMAGVVWTIRRTDR